VTKHLKWIIPLLIILLMTSTVFAARTGKFTFSKSAATTSPDVVYQGNFVTYTFNTTTTDSMDDGTITGNQCDTNVIFPPYGNSDAAGWELLAPGLDVSAFKNVRGWITITDTTGWNDSLRAGFDTLLVYWQTSTDNKYWFSLNAITGVGTVATALLWTNAAAAVKGRYSELPWNGVASTSAATARYSTIVATPVIGRYLRAIMVRTGYTTGTKGPGGAGVTTSKWKVVIEAEKK
jgi:hypothetical protein